MDWHVTTNDLGNARPYGNPHVTWFTNKAQITGILPISVNDSRKTFVRLTPTGNIFRGDNFISIPDIYWLFVTFRTWFHFYITLKHYAVYC